MTDKLTSRRFYGWDADGGVLQCNVCGAVPSHPGYPHAEFCPLPALEQAESALAAALAQVEALEDAGQRLADATEAVAEASTRLIGGKYVLRTRAGSEALERLFIANRDWAALVAVDDPLLTS